MNENKHNQHETDEVMQGHAYDGIEELDNPLPRWWLYGFYLTIVFSFFYVAYYELGPGTSLSEIYQAEVAQIQAARAEKQGKGVDANVLLAALGDKSAVEQGHTLFAERCAACHGELGQGIIGPNLTDKYWLHGGKPEQVLAVVQKGVLDKGMPSWEESMNATEMAHTVAYIVSLQGSNPPDAKEPQGVADDADDSDDHHESHDDNDGDAPDAH